MALIDSLVRNISSFGEKTVSGVNSLRNNISSHNNQLTKITKDLAGHFINLRGSLDNISSSNRQTSNSLDSLNSKMDTNSNLVRQSVSNQTDMISLLKNSNKLLADISKNIKSLSGASSGIGDDTGGATDAASMSQKFKNMMLKISPIAAGGVLGGITGGGLDFITKMMNFGGGTGGGTGTMPDVDIMGNVTGTSPSAIPTTSPPAPGAAARPTSGGVRDPRTRDVGGARTPFSPAAASESASEKQKSIVETANRLGIPPNDLATVISYETGGTFSPAKWGGTGGKYLGLIQFGPNEQRKYGVHQNQSFTEQMKAVEKFLIDRGFKKWLDQNPNATDQERRTALYSTINAGSPGQKYWGKSDKPGHNVMTHTQSMFAGDHAKKASNFMSGSYTTQSLPGGAAPAPTSTSTSGAASAPTSGRASAAGYSGSSGVQPQTPAGSTNHEQQDQKGQQQYTIKDGRAQLKTQSGVAYEVDAKFAKNFEGFVRDLEATGYRIKTISSYREGATVKGSGKPSFHSRGMAIDINAATNPHTFPGDPNYGKRDLPDNVGQLAAKHGLGWGGNWRSSKDTMHFSAGASEGATVSGGETQNQNAGVSQQPGQGQGQQGLGGATGGMSSLGGLGGMGGMPGMGMFGMLPGMGMMGGRMGAFGALAGMALGGLGAAMGSASAVPLSTPSTAGIDYTGLADSGESKGRYFEADKKLTQMMQSRQIQNAAIDEKNKPTQPIIVNNNNQNNTTRDAVKEGGGPDTNTQAPWIASIITTLLGIGDKTNSYA